jgi:ATP-dependent DNA helicase RecQ
VKKVTRRGSGQLDYDEELFRALRILRKRIADAAGVPPFVVFGDATLAEMAASQPTSEAALLQINGVGRHKLERYGADFLTEILRYHAG